MTEAIERFHEAIRYCYHRKVFETQSGHLGIGPRASQDGDVIAVSKLSQWPMVLRRAEYAGPDHYTMVGPTFIEGVEDGEEIFAEAEQGEVIGTIHLI